MTQYISKSALVAEIEGLKSAAETMLTGKTDLPYWKAQKHLCERFLSFIDTLEVKEMESIQEDPCDGCTNRKGCITCENGELRETVQKEPVSNPIDFEKELYKAFGQVKDFTLGMQIAKRFYNMGRFDAHIQDGDKIAINKDGVRTNISRLHRIAKKYGPINNDLWEAAQTYYEELQKENFEGSDVIDAYYAGAQWQKQQDQETIELAEDHAMLAGMEKMREQMMKNIWKPADGDDLPEIDREVIALLNNGKVVFAHRPPEYWDGKNIETGKVTRYYPKTYDKGGWNVSDIAYWLDVELPK